MFCKNCGAQLNDGATFCQSCGAKIGEEVTTTANRGSDGLGIAAKVFMIISCVSYAISIVGLIALIWVLPITISVSKKIKSGEKIGTGLKIAVLLLVNTIAGILLLCRKED